MRLSPGVILLSAALSFMLATAWVGGEVTIFHVIAFVALLISGLIAAALELAREAES